MLKNKGVRTALKRDWRSEPEDVPVQRIDSVHPNALSADPHHRGLGPLDDTPAMGTEIDSPPPGTAKTVSGVRQKGETPNAATIDEVVADLRKDARRE